MHCALHTPTTRRAKPSFSAPHRGELAIEGAIHQMGHVERQPPNPSRLARTSHPAPAARPPPPPTTPPAARRPRTPRRAEQVIGPLSSSLRDRAAFPQIVLPIAVPFGGVLLGWSEMRRFLLRCSCFLFAVRGFFVSRLLVRGTMRKYFILYLLGLISCCSS